MCGLYILQHLRRVTFVGYFGMFYDTTCVLLGRIASCSASDSAYCHTLLRIVVRLSVTFMRPA